MGDPLIHHSREPPSRRISIKFESSDEFEGLASDAYIQTKLYSIAKY